jgi:hypothetical protein
MLELPVWLRYDRVPVIYFAAHPDDETIGAGDNSLIGVVFSRSTPQMARPITWRMRGDVAFQRGSRTLTPGGKNLWALSALQELPPSRPFDSTL